MELLIPTLNKITSYQFLLNLLERENHEQSSQNNQSTWCFPPKVWGDFFKKSFSRRDKHFWGKYLWEVVLNRRTNDQIMATWARSFINDKCIFQ